MAFSKKQSLSGLSEEELTKIIQDYKWPAFKGMQLFQWIYQKNISSLDEMTNISAKDRELLKENYIFSPLKLKKKEISKDKTIKYLWELQDKNFVESVRMVMDENDSFTACISSQVGCAVGCPFCATGTLGLKRNLKANEIVDQILSIQRDTKERIKNIVFMGQGEPLQNYTEVIKAISIIRNSVGIGARHITLSTSGIPPNIIKLADEKIPLTLAISLHAPDQKTREHLVPISQRYKLEELMESINYFYNKTKRRITFEYVMLEGINDELSQAKELGRLIKNIHCHVNLIPYNPILTKGINSSFGSSLNPPNKKNVYLFKETLEKSSRKNVTVRHERGQDINAACGQLANQYT